MMKKKEVPYKYKSKVTSIASSYKILYTHTTVHGRKTKTIIKHEKQSHTLLGKRSFDLIFPLLLKEKINTKTSMHVYKQSNKWDSEDIKDGEKEKEKKRKGKVNI